MLLPLVEQDELPHLWQKPAFPVLLEYLKNLRVEPKIWSLKESRADILKEQAAIAQAHGRREVISFLSSVIKSKLQWLNSDAEREVIWEEASKRLSERCGRTAMGEITRQWPFESQAYEPFSLVIREPPLVGDFLGFKTWGSSYALAQLLHDFAVGPLEHLFRPGVMSTPEEVLELGSGTGLLGLAAACIWRARVTLTDLPNIIPNLAHNVSLNKELVESRGGVVEAAPLTWGGTAEEIDPRFYTHNRYQLVLAADPLYDDNHPQLLSQAINEQLALGTKARALIMVPQRDDVTKCLLATLREELVSNSLCCLNENMVAGQDDWGDDAGEEETKHVGFWWGIFARVGA